MDLGCDLRSRHDVEERDPEAWRTLTLALGPKCDELEEPDILHSIRPRAPTYYILFDPGPRRSHPTSDPDPVTGPNPDPVPSPNCRHERALAP